jgi:hypothetical protein
MSTTPPTKNATRPLIPLKTLQRAVSDATRWRILDTLLQKGPLTTELITKAVHGSVAAVSKHLVFMRESGILEHRMRRLYAIPEGFLVPGERAVDFGPIVLRFDQAK